MIGPRNENATGIVCLRCGTHMPLPVYMSKEFSSHGVEAMRFPLFIVRCSGCGKEASYLAGEVVVFPKQQNSCCVAA